MKSSYDVILRPIISEDSMERMKDEKYVFKADKNANKTEVRNAIKKISDAKIKSVNTMNVKGKVKRISVYSGRRSDWKEVIVTLTEDLKEIEFFKGI